MTHSCLRQDPALAILGVEDDYLVYSLTTGKLHRLNSAAALLFELCDGKRSVDAICQLVTDAGEQDPAPLHAWLELASKQQLLTDRQQDPSSAAPGAEVFAQKSSRLRDTGEVLAAYVCQHQATQFAPDDTGHWLELGELAHILGRRSEARAAYECVVQLSPENAEARHILRALNDETPPDRAPDDCILQLYARFSGFYEQNMVEDLGYEAPQRIAEILQRFYGDSDSLKVLELGCGTGLAGTVLRKYAAHLTGIDLSPDMVEHCRKTGLYDELLVAEITGYLANQLASAEQYQLIAACDTLIYFGDLSQVLGPSFQLLAPGGRLLFTVEKGTREPFNLTDSGRYAHTISHVRAAAAAAGFTVLALDECFLRYEYGEAVTGLGVMLERATSD